MPVVTQASQLAHEFNLVSTSTQQMNRNNLREAFLDIQEEEYILEHANLKTTPIMAPSTVAYFPTPMNPSPDTSKKRIHSMMDSATMNSIDRATAARDMVSLASSTSKKRCNPKGTLLTFLRNDDITNQACSLMESRGTPKMNPSSTLQLAKLSWFNASTLTMKDEKFKDFKRKMDVAFI